MKRAAFKQTQGNLSMRSRMLLLCLAVALPLLAIGCFSLYHEYKTLRSEASTATSFQAAIAVSTLGQWQNAQLAQVHALSCLPSLEPLDTESTKRTFDNLLRGQPYWQQIALLDRNGKTLLAVSKPSVKPYNCELEGRDFIDQVRQMNKPLLSGYRKSALNARPALLAGSPVISGSKSGQVPGKILVVSIDPDSVLALFDNLASAQGAVIAVIDDQKRVVARTLQNRYWQGKDFSHAKTVQASSKKKRGTLEVVGIADPVARAYAFDHLPGSNWVIVVGTPLESIYGSAHQWLWTMTLCALLATALSLSLALSVTSRFTKSIGELVREALAIGRGDLSKRVRVNSKDELGLLARAFNEMAIRLEMQKDQESMVETISDSIRQSLDLDRILETTVMELGGALNASRCCLALIDIGDEDDINDDELVFNHVWWDPERKGEPLKTRNLRIADNLVFEQMLAQGSVLSLDVLDQENAGLLLFSSTDGNKTPDDWKTVRSLLACPINTSSQTLGLILVHQCDSLRVWSDSELDLVQTLARHVALAVEHANLFNRTKTLAEQESLINNIVRSVRGSLDLDTILNTVTVEVGRALKVDRCQIAQPGCEGPLVVTHEFHQPELAPSKGLSLYSDYIDFHPNIGVEASRLPNGMVLGVDLSNLDTTAMMDLGTGTMDSIPAFSQQAYEGKTPEAPLTTIPPAVIDNIYRDVRAIPFHKFLLQCQSKSVITAPLLHENRLVGLLLIHQSAQMRHWTDYETRLVEAIADQVAVAITHASLFAQVKYQAITDGLTGLYNHVYFKRRLAQEIKRAQRKGSSCALLMVDLDKLKQINDTFGHPIGDAAIKHISAVLKTLLRSGDIAARYGGEEFGVILPETSLMEAALIAERLCATVRNTNVPMLGRVSASIGAASFPANAQNVDELIEKADKALYVAKNSGRDQARIYEEEEVPDSLPSGVYSRPSNDPNFQ